MRAAVPGTNIPVSPEFLSGVGGDDSAKRQAVQWKYLRSFFSRAPTKKGELISPFLTPVWL
jgi:hypothetical protein